ncbi:MAG: Ig-like domain-containing protein [Candidatus Contendobacter sp.]|nr:Ig-like domain-containing protein [Candidatus Contendobacter sp.]
MTFQEGSTVLGTGTLTQGSATLTVNTLTAGAHSLTAVYSGNPAFAASVSPTIIQQVTVDIPTLSEWAMLLLTLLLGGLAWRPLAQRTPRLPR